MKRILYLKKFPSNRLCVNTNTESKHSFKNNSIFLILILLLTGISFSGCIGSTNKPANGPVHYTYYGTVSYDGKLYYIGNANNIPLEDIDPDVYYPFFKNSHSSQDGYYFINGQGQIFVNLENNYDTYPIKLTPYDLDIGAFNWSTRMDISKG